MKASNRIPRRAVGWMGRGIEALEIRRLLSANPQPAACQTCVDCAALQSTPVMRQRAARDNLCVVSSSAASSSVLPRTPLTERFFSPKDRSSDGVVMITPELKLDAADESSSYWEYTGPTQIPDGGWVRVHFEADEMIPPDAQVTRVTVRHKATHPCTGDLRATLQNEAQDRTWVLRNRTGGYAPSFDETVTELSVFDAQPARQDWWYSIYDDGYYDVGTLDLCSLWIYYDSEGLVSNLAPYQPSGWSDAIVVSNRTGTNSDDSPLLSTDVLYVDWAGVNNGTAATESIFHTELYVDDVRQAVWRIDPPLEVGYCFFAQDCRVGALSAGTHTIRVVQDSGGAIGESNEMDNIYARTLTIERAETPPVIGNLPDRTLDEDNVLGMLAQRDPPLPPASVQPLGPHGDFQPLEDSSESGVRFRLFDEWPGTWTDAEKDLKPGDDLMCWAGAASNVLEWGGWGNSLGINNSDDIFEHLIDHWSDAGSLPCAAFQYWFDGTNRFANQAGWSKIDVPGGGCFYSSFDPADYIFTRMQGTAANAAAMTDIDDYCRAGYGVALGLFGSIGHAVTCWGFNYDSALSPSDPAYYKGVWITDSDDNKYTVDGRTAPDVLHYYAVSWNPGRGRYDFDSYYPGAFIGEVDALARRSVDTCDLWNYAYDAETPDDGLRFSITGNTNPQCGVSIESDRWLRIAPAADWHGLSDVTITVSDGTLSSSDTFRITVNSVNDPPVVHSLCDDPDPLTRGITLSLSATASDPHDPEGSIADVTFYRESNAVDGLQIGSGGDSSVGAGANGEDGWSAAVNTSSLSPGTYTYYALATDNSGATSEAGKLAVCTSNVVQPDDTTPPAAVAQAFNVLIGPHELKFVFSEDVSDSLDAADLELVNLSTSTVVPASSVAVSYDAATDTATFTVPGNSGGLLTNGDWCATLPPGCVADRAGNLLASACGNRFFFLAADATRDRIVDVADLGVLATNWQHSNRAFDQGDFNYDTKVDVSDLGILASNWQASIPAPLMGAQPLVSRAAPAGRSVESGLPWTKLVRRRTPIGLLDDDLLWPVG